MPTVFPSAEQCRKNLGEWGKKGVVSWRKGKTGFTAWNKGLKGYKAGEENCRWKGGVTAENIKLRSSFEAKAWRKAVFERDNYTCQDCGQKASGRLNAHHIKSFARHPELRFEVSNGKTLCVPCHRAEHKRRNKNKPLRYVRKTQVTMAFG